MKLKSITIQNFRCYKSPIVVNFEDLTTFIGKNDIGKSTILEALEIFFNNDVVKISSDDLNINAKGEKIVITCDFSDLPSLLILDSGSETNLCDEYLTISNDLFRIKKEFDCSKSKPSEEVFIVANHPTSVGFDNLLGCKEKDLQKMVKDRNIDVSLKGNPEMRKALWSSCEDLKLKEVSISVTKDKGDASRIWNSLGQYLPIFALFQSDRSSKDSDDEVQNPMKIAIQTALSEAQSEIDAIKTKVRARAMEIANGTYEVMKTLDEDLASSLTPAFTDSALSKWGGLFSVSMNTNDDIPLNKRGSGIRRLVLVSFFKAQADKKVQNSVNKDVIYAIEEPETSLHPNYQKMIIKSFYDLSQSNHCQVILTTHSPNLASELPIESLRFVTRNEDVPVVKMGNEIIPEIVETLGILADINHKVKIMICVEGPTDVVALKCFNRCIHEKYKHFVDIEKDERIVIIPLGGSILKYWVQNEYLKKLNCKEVHIYDNDVDSYKETVTSINSKCNGSWATLTNKYEIENYLHQDAIKKIYDVVVDTNIKDVPKRFGEEYSKKQKFDGVMKGQKSKMFLSKVFEEAMSMDYLSKIGAEEEIKGWFEKITNML